MATNFDDIRPEIVESLVERKSVEKRVFPHFFRIGAFTGAAYEIGKRTQDSLLIPAGKTVQLTFKTPSMGHVRILRMLLKAWILDNGKFWESQDRTGSNLRKLNTFTRFLSCTMRVGSTGNAFVEETFSTNASQNNTADNGNVAVLVGNRVPGHARLNVLLGCNDFLTVTLTNHANFDLYVGGCMIGYRIV